MKIVQLMALASMIVGCLFSCTTKPANVQNIDFDSYSLDGTSCSWSNLDDTGSQSKLLIIDSEEEFDNYVTGDDRPPVDFAEKTLLLAYGGYENSAPIYSDSQKIVRISRSNYVLTVNIPPVLIAALMKWRVAILVDKLDAEDNVKLKITTE